MFVLNLHMDKPSLRRLYKQKRLALSPAEKAALEERMLVHFQQFNWPSPKELFTYLPSEKFREPDTIPFIRHLRSGTACNLSGPVIDASGETMQAVRFDEGSIFNINSFGVPEPPNGEVVPPGEIDMVLVPLLVFDLHGNRIGYGKGHYDKFLQQCRKNIVLAGLSFFEPEAAFGDVPEFDVPLTHCITPEQIYAF